MGDAALCLESIPSDMTVACGHGPAYTCPQMVVISSSCDIRVALARTIILLTATGQSPHAVMAMHRESDCSATSLDRLFVGIAASSCAVSHADSSMNNGDECVGRRAGG